MEDPQTVSKTDKDLTGHLSASEYSVRMPENLYQEENLLIMLMDKFRAWLKRPLIQTVGLVQIHTFFFLCSDYKAVLAWNIKNSNNIIHGASTRPIK